MHSKSVHTTDHHDNLHSILFLSFREREIHYSVANQEKYILFLFIHPIGETQATIILTRIVNEQQQLEHTTLKKKHQSIYANASEWSFDIVFRKLSSK